jgi:ribokinase
MPTIAVVGSIITDLAVATPRLPARGENILAHRLQIGPGGKGANAAVAAARLGARALLVGRIGDDYFGRQELATLHAEGVDVSAVGIDPTTQTGAAIILIDEAGENTILVVIGANDTLTPAHVEAGLAPHWGVLDAILINFEVPPAAVAAAVRGAQIHGVPSVVDAGPPRAWGPEIWGGATVISPNELEAATLVGVPITNDADAEMAARLLLAAGPQAVVLKRGAAGALLVTGALTQHFPSFRVDVVDTTGAGDAFSAALTIGLAEGKPLAEAVRFANAAGALAVTRLGTLPAMPTRAETEALLAR